MGSSIKWFGSGFGLAFGIAAATAIATASNPGDILLEKGGAKIEITAQQAACYLTCAKDAGVVPAGIPAANMYKACAMRTTVTDTGFAGTASYVEATAPADIPDGEFTARGVVQ